MRQLLFPLSLIVSFYSFAQNPAFNIVVNNYKIDNSDNSYRLFFETRTGLVAASSGNSFLIPQNIAPEAIESVKLYTTGKDTLTFYSKAILEYNQLPESLVRQLLPDYKKAFSERADIRLDIDTYPFEYENSDNAKLKADYLKVKESEIAVFALFYDMKTDNPGKLAPKLEFQSLLDSLSVGDTLQVDLYVNECEEWGGIWEGYKFYLKNKELFFDYYKDPKECGPEEMGTKGQPFRSTDTLTITQVSIVKELLARLEKYPEPAQVKNYKWNLARIKFRRLHIDTNNSFLDRDWYMKTRDALFK